MTTLSDSPSRPERQIRTAFFWSFSERLGQQVLQFGIAVILARLLTPAEYGLVGMLTVFLALATVFSDAGFSSGLIQRREITADEETSIFYLNIFAGAVLTILLCAVSPLLAAFFRQPLIRPLLCVLSLQLFFSSFGIVQYALLTREVDFKTQAVISSLSTVLSGIIGIAMAWTGWGVWSLVGQSISRALFGSVLVWFMRPWRPVGQFRLASLGLLWPYSSRLLASGMLNTLFDNIYSVVIGRFYLPVDLGHFSRANQMAQLPAGLVQSAIGRVMFPVMARRQDDKGWIKERFRSTTRAIASIHFPAMTILAGAAPALVACLLTDKWLPCVPYFQVLCFSGLLYPLHAMHLDTLIAQGRSDLFFRLEIIKKALVVIAVAATFRWGVFWMVRGMLTLSIAGYFINGYYTRAMIGYSWHEQGRDLLPILGASLGTGAAVWSLNAFGPERASMLLLAQVAVGVTVYALFVLAGRNQTYFELFQTSSQCWRKITGYAAGL